MRVAIACARAASGSSASRICSSRANASALTRERSRTRATPCRRSRSALSGWSWLNGTTSMGRPASIAWPVVPTPPWCTTAHARGMTSECGA
jgi:hypothetical protein